MGARLAAQGGGGDLAQQCCHLHVRIAGLDEVEHRGRRGQVAPAESHAELGAVRHADEATPWRSATSATMSRMICVRSKSLGV